MAKTKTVTIDALDARYYNAIKAMDADSGIPPWLSDKWDTILNRKSIVGCVALSGKRVIGFALYDDRPAYYSLLKLVVHQDYNYDEVGGVLLNQYKGKITAWVRGKNYKLCNLLKDMKVAFKLYEKDKYENPNDDGYKFEGVIL